TAFTAVRCASLIDLCAVRKPSGTVPIFAGHHRRDGRREEGHRPKVGRECPPLSDGFRLGSKIALQRKKGRIRRTSLLATRRSPLTRRIKATGARRISFQAADAAKDTNPPREQGKRSRFPRLRIGLVLDAILQVELLGRGDGSLFADPKRFWGV